MIDYFKTTTLPTLCLDLRMACNGSADPMKDEDRDGAIAYLQGRLDAWKPAVRGQESFDEAVRQLVIATLAEVKGNIAADAAFARDMAAMPLGGHMAACSFETAPEGPTLILRAPETKL